MDTTIFVHNLFYYISWLHPCVGNLVYIAICLRYDSPSQIRCAVYCRFLFAGEQENFEVPTGIRTIRVNGKIWIPKGTGITTIWLLSKY